MKTLILILACLLLVVPCQAVEKQVEQEEQIKQQIKWRLKNQEDRLKDIKELVTRELQGIEDWYLRRLTELKLLAERRARKLEPAYRIFWTEFIRTYNQAPYADSYFSYTAPTFIRDGDTKAFKLRDDMIKCYSLITAADFLIDSNFRKLLTDIANSHAQSLAIRKEARKLLRLVKEFESDLMRLRNQKKVKLAALEQWEKCCREDVFRVMRQIKAQPRMPECGVVSAISYDEKEAFCMVDGVDRILKPGDMINELAIKNVKVLKIYRDKVEFEKKGKRWTQKVQETPGSQWTK